MRLPRLKLVGERVPCGMGTCVSNACGIGTVALMVLAGKYTTVELI